jgi:hypothetical protein
MRAVPQGSDPFSILVGKALVDCEFRAKVLDQARQKEALQEAGIAEPTQQQLDALRRSITALEGLEGEFSSGVGTA